MKEKYWKWIRLNALDPKGNCRKYAHAMKEAFPELILVRGHYRCLVEGLEAHWWCVDPDDNTIVDPTAAQFLDLGLGEYIPWDESQPEPTGKCLNCGGLAYNGEYHCSPKCEQETKKLYGYA